MNHRHQFTLTTIVLSALVTLSASGQTINENLKLTASDAAANDQFGNSIAIDNGVVAIGATDDDDGNSSGSAYVFDTGIGATCSADLTNDGIVDFFDVSAFLQAFAAMEPIADFTGEGVYDFFDVSEFLQAFAQGCS